MKLAIVGSRTFDDFEYLSDVISRIKSVTEIVSGGADGTDSLAEKYAKKNLIPTKIFLPKFKTDSTIAYHPKWFFARNEEIVNHSDYVLVFWDGRSSGTKHVMEYARRKHKLIKVIYFKKE